jgi:hypothetical protein
MSKKVAYRHADWLSLVDSSGSFLSVAVLNRAFPSGLDRNEVEIRQRVRDHFPTDASDPALQTKWIEWVLSDLLRWGARVRSGPGIGSAFTHIVGQHHATLRPDYTLVEPTEGAGEETRAFVTVFPPGTNLSARLPGDTWTATPTERLSLLLRSADIPLGIVTNGNEWRLVWAPREGSPATATFTASLFSEEPALLDAFTSIVGAKQFFAVAEENTIEELFRESATAQEVVADQLGRQVRGASEILIAALSRANRERNGDLLQGHTPTEVYSATITVLMRLVFLLFAEERGLLPLDDDLYARSYALSTLRQQLQEERDLYGDEPLERRNSAWNRLLALFRAVHGGVTHDALRLPPYGGRLFDPDRFPFLEGRTPGENWRTSESQPIPIDDLSVLEILRQLQILQFTDGGIRESRLLSYRTLEVEQIGHVYEGLLDHSVSLVEDVVLGLVGRAGDEPEVQLADMESKFGGSRASFLSWLKEQTGKTENALVKFLENEPEEADRQLLAAAVENDEVLFDRILPFVNLLRPDIRQLPTVMLAGSVYVTQTSLRREGGVEYTTRDLADEVAMYTLEPLVYSPGPQDGADSKEWVLRPSSEILELKVCDPAVGSGAILVAAGRYLADRLIEAWLAEGADEAIGEPEEVLVNARRAIADRCLYGVDRDPLAAEMAKLSLWLTTMSKDRPFTFLDHSIRAGDALLGVTSLDQIRWMHLDPASGKKLHNSLFDYTSVVQPLVDNALQRRRQLADIRVITVRDAEEKARLTEEADRDMELLRAAGDLVVAATLVTANQPKSDTDSKLLSAAENISGAIETYSKAQSAEVENLREEANRWLNTGKPDSSPGRLCLHWPIEFPEVFLSENRKGFDACLGNPPFIGGQKITGSVGDDVRKYCIAHIAGGKKGSADLVAYFFLRAVAISGSFGFLATNTIAEGATSEVGLAQIIDRSWTIYRATSSSPWPGRASLEIAKVWGTCVAWNGATVLDGLETSAGIDEMLYAKPRSGWRKKTLRSNTNLAFQGSNVLGMGFTMPPEDAQELISKDPRNADVLFPFIGGEDLNQSPTQSATRWIINFHDWPKEKAESYTDCFEIVEKRVKPERQRHGFAGWRKKSATYYWQYEGLRVELAGATAEMDRCLALSSVSKTVMPVFVSPNQVLSHATVVVALDDYFSFGVLTSGFHYRWAIRYSSSMRTDTRYTVSDLFETFPLPEDSDRIAEIGKNLDESRGIEMVHSGRGLTSLYNRFHDSSESSASIKELRRLHVELDRAVCRAYGWDDLTLDHGFHEVRGQGTRFTFDPAEADEILERLLELNRDRYEAEQAIPQIVEAGREPKRKKSKASVSSDSPSLFDIDGD